MITGSVITVIWHNVPVLKGFVYELVPAFIFALVAVVVGSLLTRPPAEVDIDDRSRR
jgi:Na+/proline symporter